MDERRCEACGAQVSRGALACPVCGADPDVMLVEIGHESTRRRLQPSGIRHPIGRRWLAACAAVVAVWLVVAFVASDDDDQNARGVAPTPERTTATSDRRRTSPTSTASTTISGAPLLGEPTGLTLILSGDREEAVDVDTGVVTRLDVGEVVMAQDDGLVTRGGGGLVWHPWPVTAGQAVDLGPGDLALPAGGGDRVWVVGYGPAPSGRLVRLDGGTVARLELPPGGGPFPVTMGDALAVAAGGRVYVYDRDGSVTEVAVGDLLGTAGDRLVVRQCDIDLHCVVTLLHPVTGETQTLDDSGQSAWSFGWHGSFATAPDGRLATVVPQLPEDGTGSFSSAEVVILNPDGDRQVVTEVQAYGPTAVAWSSDGRWLFWLDGTEAWAVDTADGSIHKIRIPGGPAYWLGVIAPG
ncbi:MAG: zinc ribbon domain-containing protein [Acidimicrobiales bacterium]